MSRTWTPVNTTEKRFLEGLSTLLLEEASSVCQKEKEEGKHVTLDHFLHRADLYCRQLHDMLEAKFRSSWEEAVSKSLTSVIKQHSKKEEKKNDSDEEKQLKLDL